MKKLERYAAMFATLVVFSVIVWANATQDHGSAAAKDCRELQTGPSGPTEVLVNCAAVTSDFTTGGGTTGTYTAACPTGPTGPECLTRGSQSGDAPNAVGSSGISPVECDAMGGEDDLEWCTNNDFNCGILGYIPWLFNPDDQMGDNLFIVEDAVMHCNENDPPTGMRLGGVQLVRYTCVHQDGGPGSGWHCSGRKIVGEEWNKYCSWGGHSDSLTCSPLSGRPHTVTGRHLYDVEDYPSKCHAWQLIVYGRYTRANTGTSIHNVPKVVTPAWLWGADPAPHTRCVGHLTH